MNAEQSHPITLHQVFFVRSVVISHAGHEPGQAAVLASPSNTLEVHPVPNAQRFYQAHMRCMLNPEGDPAEPYTIDMECVGNFEAHASLTPEEAQRGVLITANSVLYGAIREAVSWITGRQPYGAVTLGLSVLQAPPPGQTPGQGQTSPANR